MTAATATGEIVRGAEAPSPAVAPPPGSPRFALVDSLRGIAVLCVLVFHVTSITGVTNDRVIGDTIIVLGGSRAVILFFVISGFLLYRPFLAARAAGRPVPSVARYARRRVLRIIPAYWLALTALAVFPGIAGVFSGDWWRYYFFLQLYSYRAGNGGIAPAWSLCVEVTFYLLLPIWALAIRRARLGAGPRGWVLGEIAGLAAVTALGVLVQVLAARRVVTQLAADSLLGQSTWFALGMALALASVVIERAGEQPRIVRAVAERPAWCWLGAIGALAGLTAILHPGGLFGVLAQLQTKQPYLRIFGSIVLTYIFTTLLVLPAVFGENAGGVPRRVLAWAPLAWVGLVSYGLYLYHLTVVQLLALGTHPPAFQASGLGLVSKLSVATTPVLLGLTVGVSVALAAISYYLVELPFLRRKEPGSRRTRTGLAPEVVHPQAAEITTPALSDPAAAERHD